MASQNRTGVLVVIDLKSGIASLGSVSIDSAAFRFTNGKVFSRDITHSAYRRHIYPTSLPTSERSRFDATTLGCDQVTTILTTWGMIHMGLQFISLMREISRHNIMEISLSVLPHVKNFASNLPYVMCGHCNRTMQGEKNQRITELRQHICSAGVYFTKNSGVVCPSCGLVFTEISTCIGHMVWRRCFLDEHNVL